MNTSHSHPLRIGELQVPGSEGRIGVTFCPGKHDWYGEWARDLDVDLDAIRDWGAHAVVTLIEDHEFDLLRVRGLGDAVVRRGIAWHHLPIEDVSIPDARFEEEWESVGVELCDRLRKGQRILVHCRGGVGRAGTIAARLLIELGMEPHEAITAVRRARPGAIETLEQESYVRNRAWSQRGDS